MRLTIDRVENDFFVCEDENKNIVNIPCSSVENSAKAGDIIDEVDGRFVVNISQTEKRRSEILDLQNSLWE